MTPQIFRDIRRIVASGHDQKSAVKVTNEAINAKYQSKVAEFITDVVDRINQSAKSGFTDVTILIPDFDGLSVQVEHLLTEHLTNRKFTVEPNRHDRKLVIRW